MSKIIGPGERHRHTGNSGFADLFDSIIISVIIHKPAKGCRKQFTKQIRSGSDILRKNNPGNLIIDRHRISTIRSCCISAIQITRRLCKFGDHISSRPQTSAAIIESISSGAVGGGIYGNALTINIGPCQSNRYSRNTGLPTLTCAIII